MIQRSAFSLRHPVIAKQDSFGIFSTNQSAMTEAPPTKRQRTEENQDDCWVHIFKRLPLKKRIQLEGVSPKWNRLMPYSDITSADLNDFVWPEHRMIQKGYGPQERPGTVVNMMVPVEDLRHVLMGVLSRCGHNLRHLVLKLTYPLRFFFGLNKNLADLLVEKAPKLVTLNLAHCALSLRFFPPLAYLVKLEELQLSGHVMFTVDDLSSRIQNQGAIEPVLSFTIQRLPTLKKLNLRSWADVCPPIQNSSLRELKINGGTLTAARVQDLVRQCPDLESLDINIKGNPLYLQLGALGSLHQLKSLSLNEGILRSGDLAAICRGCPKLEKLKINGGTLTAASVQDLVHQCPDLESLDINIKGNPLYLQLGALGSLHQLKSLSLNEGILRSGDLAAVCRGCPKLEKLKLFSMEELTSCAELWRLLHLKHLVVLNFFECPVDDAALASVARYGLLEYISLPWANHLTDVGLNALVQCPNLITLDIVGTAITDEGIKAVLENCKCLKKLFLTFTNIGDETTMASIGAKGVSLTLADLQETGRATEDGISCLVEERGKRLAEGAELVPLKVRVECCCTIPQKDLDAINLEVYSRNR